jgi:hypothetical protein
MSVLPILERGDGVMGSVGAALALAYLDCGRRPAEVHCHACLSVGETAHAA